MAGDVVTTQTLLDSDRNLIMRFTNVSDGTGEIGVTKVNISNLIGLVPDEVRIEKVDYSISSGSVILLWDASTPVTAVILAPGEDEKNFEKIGGIINNAGAGKTGDILLTFDGAVSGDTYDITLCMKKKTRNKYNS